MRRECGAIDPVVVSILVACIDIKSLKRQARVQIGTGVGQDDQIGSLWPVGRSSAGDVARFAVVPRMALNQNLSILV